MARKISTGGYAGMGNSHCQIASFHVRLEVAAIVDWLRSDEKGAAAEKLASQEAQAKEPARSKKVKKKKKKKDWEVAVDMNMEPKRGVRGSGQEVSVRLACWWVPCQCARMWAWFWCLQPSAHTHTLMGTACGRLSKLPHDNLTPVHKGTAGSHAGYAEFLFCLWLNVRQGSRYFPLLVL